MNRARQQEFRDLKKRAEKLKVRLELLDTKISSISPKQAPLRYPGVIANVDQDKCVGCGIC